jgi:DNA replication and repair protein RecF
MTDNNNIIEFIISKLNEARSLDRVSRRTNFGTHRSDLIVIHREKKTVAKFCSTGEQKAMLVTIILAKVESAMKEASIAPLLLLDEIFTHLDNRRKEYLTDFLISSSLQAWITATDTQGIERLVQQSQLIPFPISSSLL